MNVSISHPTDRPNFTEVTLGGKTVYFSYKTPIAFRGSKGLIIRKNDWSVTTGKHLNWICDDKTARINGSDFTRELETEFGPEGISL